MKAIIYCGIVISLFSSCVRSVCIENGRFPNNSAADCRGFIMCLKGAAGFMEYQLNCPENSIFTHIDSQCTNITEYTCAANYNCTREEVIPEPSNCTSYLTCIKDLNGQFSARRIQCPLNTAFNGSLCVDKELYQCPEQEKPFMNVTIENFEGNISINCSSMAHLHLCFVILSLVIVTIQ